MNLIPQVTNRIAALNDEIKYSEPSRDAGNGWASNPYPDLGRIPSDDLKS